MNILTDQYFTYRQSASSVDGVAQLSIKGNTIGWNQLVNNGNFADTSNWYARDNATLTASNNVGTLTTTSASISAIVNRFSYVLNHTYLIRVSMKSSSGQSVGIGITNNNGTLHPPFMVVNPTSEWKDYYVVGVANDAPSGNSGYDGLVIRNNNASAQVVDIKNVQVIDLTMLNDSRVTDYNSFKQYYPLDWYSFNQGTLINFNGDAIKTTGKNLLESANLQIGKNWIYSSATNRAIWEFDCEPNTKYHIDLDYSTTITTVSMVYKVGHVGSQISNTSYRTQKHIDLTTPNGCNVVCIQFESSANISSSDFYAINRAYLYGDEQITSLPVADYFPTGMKSANNAYDEFGSKAITRVANVDLGTLTYTIDAGNTLYAPVTGLKGVGQNEIPNILCALFTSIKYSDRGSVSYPNISITSDLNIRFGNTGYTDTTAFKSAMSGVYLNYELSTYTEVDISPIYYNTFKDGTEEILPNSLMNGVVDLGSLTWSYVTGTTPSFRATLSGMEYVALATSLPNFACAEYTTTSYDNAINNSVDKTISNRWNTETVVIVDLSYSDVASFTQAMQGVLLYYEKSDSTPYTSPLWADITYYTSFEGEIPYRKFWLVNGNGDRWDFTKHELKSFLNEPQGLGFQKSIDITRYGERAVKNSETYNFPTVSGDLLFYDSPNSTRYEKYNEFVRFLMNQPITLYYQIPVSFYSRIADIYTLKCDVMQLTKTESKTNRMLTSNISLNGMEFYQGEEVVMSGSSPTVTINNNGDFPVGFEIEINGDIKNPYFTLEQNGELYGESKFNDDASNFSSIYVNSKDGEQYVVLKQNNSILPNPLAYQDLSISNGSIYVTFVKLARGESTLTIGGDSLTLSDYTIRFIPTYRSV